MAADDPGRMKDSESTSSSTRLYVESRRAKPVQWLHRPKAKRETRKYHKPGPASRVEAAGQARTAGHPAE